MHRKIVGTVIFCLFSTRHGILFLPCVDRVSKVMKPRRLHGASWRSRRNKTSPGVSIAFHFTCVSKASWGLN